MNVVALTASDGLFRHWVLKMLHSADKRVGQSTLDFWRATYIHKIKENRDCFGIFAVENGEPIGCSLASISPKGFVSRSVTIVAAPNRRQKVASILLQAKLVLLTSYYSPFFFETTVGATNDGGNKLCAKLGLTVVRNGETPREGKEATSYNVYANIQSGGQSLPGSGA